MRSALLLPIIVGVAVAVGGMLYLFGSSAFQRSSMPSNTNDAIGQEQSPRSGNTDFTVLAKGQNASNVDQRVNYRITEADQFSALWQMIYGANGPSVPVVDFSRQEVIALFDGSHSTGGYSISLKDINDKNGARVITIVHTEPGDSCTTTAAASSPYVLITVAKTDLAFGHEEVTETTECP